MSLSAVNWKALQNGSDIRGIALPGVPHETVNLTPAVVTQLSQAFTDWLSQRRDKAPNTLTIALGRDSRLSGDSLAAAAIAGISRLGARVINVGLASTPAMFMSTVHPITQADGAIMLTASHLPFNRNGLKFFTAQGGLDKADISAILALAAQGTAVATIPGSVENLDFMGHYAASLVEFVRARVNHPDHYDQPLRGLNIIVDAGNGAGGFYVDRVLHPLGADTTGSQFLEPDGHFPNHVPNPEDNAAMAAICQAVLAHQADLGIIFDTDVDRGAAVDAHGQALNRNRLIALLAAITLREYPGTTIVTDSITSTGLTYFIEQKLGGKHHRFKRGYKNVINEAIRLNQAGHPCHLAIETSGHGAIKENYFLDDGAYLVTKLLVELARLQQTGQSLTALIADLPEPQESQEFRLAIHAADFKAYGQQVITDLEAFSQDQPDWQIAPSNYEGIRVNCTGSTEKGWFLLRLSLHDPVIPLNIESEVAGGVATIAKRLQGFLQHFSELDQSPFD
jgi:phosphomannomutase